MRISAFWLANQWRILCCFVGASLPFLFSSLAQETPVPQGVKPAEVVTGEYRAKLPAKAPTQVPFTAYQIKVAPTHSSMVIELAGEGGDADLLLVADEPMKVAQDSLFASVSPTSAERIELRRNTVPTLRSTDYFLYVFHSEEEGGTLDVSIDLNTLADDGLEEMPKLAAGVISHEGQEQQVPWLMTLTQSAMVNLAMPAGSAPGETLVRLQVAEGTRTLEVDLWGNLSDIDLFLLGPEVEGQERVELSSEKENSREQILLRSGEGGKPIPTGDWLLTLKRKDQVESEPLLLRVDMR